MKMERDFAFTFVSNTNTTHLASSFPTTDCEFNINYSPEPNININSSIFNDPNINDLPPLNSSDPSNSIFNFFGQSHDFPSLPLQPQLPSSTTSSLLLPPQIPDILPAHYSTQFLDFFSKSLPDLHSLDLPQSQPHLRHSRLPVDPDSSATRNLKSHRLDLNLSHSDNNRQTLDSIVPSFSSPPPRVPQSELARTRRPKLSEKIRCLQKLLPWDKKMDTATLLDKTYKYVRFLKAQVSILLSMPITSSFASTEHNAPVGFGYGGLGRLNRQQLLQVLLHSPAAQTILCSQDYCVFLMNSWFRLRWLRTVKRGFNSFSWEIKQ